MYPSCKWQNDLQSYVLTIDEFLKVKQNIHQHLMNYLNERLKSWGKNVNEETK